MDHGDIRAVSPDDTISPFAIRTSGANGAEIRTFAGARNPNGVVLGNPGDLYAREAGLTSALYVNVGAAVGNTVWQALGLGAVFVQAPIPYENDDSTAGYAVGDRIYSTAACAWYTAVSVAAGAAFWRRDSELLSSRHSIFWTPSTGGNMLATDSSFGLPNDGTLTCPAQATTSLRTSLRRCNAATAAFVAGNRGGAYYTRGDAAGIGGFFAHFVYAPVTAAADQVTAVGLVLNDPVGLFDPNSFTDCFFVGNRSTDANLQVMHNDAAGNVTAIDLGANFPATGPGPVYEIFLYGPPNAGTLYYLVRRLDSAAVAQGSAAANLPTNTVFMKPVVYIAESSGVAAAASIDVMKMYAECFGPQV